MNVEAQIVLDKFQPREYQAPIWDAIENKGYRKVIWVAPRRSGKDITSWNLAIRQCLKKVCLVYYCLPEYSHARKVIWDAIAIDGTKFLDYVPMQIVSKINQQEMKITFLNGSILQCVGADRADQTLIGTNPYAIIFSEYAVMVDVYPIIRPILAVNGGWMLAISTPRGKNHLYNMYRFAKELPDWYTLLQKTSEIQHVDPEILMRERAQMDPGLFEQEYECSFERGIEGSIYGTYMDDLRRNRQIGWVPWEPGMLVYTAWDIGVNDATSIIFFQTVADSSLIRIIDYYTNTGLGIDHYAKILQDKPYRYGSHFAPHDIKVREWGGGAITRYEKAQHLGINFIVLDQTLVIDGIENVWTHFNKFWIDNEKCRSLIDALENYRKEWDEKKQMYTSKPLKSWANHGADALRYLCQALHYTKKSSSGQDYDRARAEALYGAQGALPKLFQHDPRYDRIR